MVEEAGGIAGSDGILERSIIKCPSYEYDDDSDIKAL
jgi:hypothetical protein